MQVSIKDDYIYERCTSTSFTHNDHHFKMSTKRYHTGEAVEGAGIKFQLEQNDNSILYVVVSKFNNIAYVHIRKYYNDLPTKFGICLPVKCWYDFVGFIQDPTNAQQFSTRDLECRKTNNGSLYFICQKKDLSLYIKKPAVDSLILR